MNDFTHPDDALSEADVLTHGIMMLTSDVDLRAFHCYQTVLHTMSMRIIDLIKIAREMMNERRNERPNHDTRRKPNNWEDNDA